ncbi:hypothetical protein MMC07_005053 [Pseudocyphellaria aurata]|nr:hypothetical protein [Pseudocyphellaria aurata]
MASSSIYGIPRPKTQAKEISSSTTLAFTSQLTSLLAQQPQPATTSARARPSKFKPSIFSTHNKDTRKRAAADISQDDPLCLVQTHSTSTSAVDPATLHRSKRRLEQKARLYASMKRGDYVPDPNSASSEKRDSNLLVDFDRKWAEDIEAGRTTDTSSSSDDDEDTGREIVTYEDEFGRQRQGTKAQASRELRRSNARAYATEELARLSARPKAPDRLLGDVVQAAAFNPDEKTAEQMENIARKRDRSMTPPEEVHYDASKEIRTKGVGFYLFSKDAEGRKREMNELDREREETERNRKEREERLRKRKEAIEKRKKAVTEKRVAMLAERFLDALDGN